MKKLETIVDKAKTLKKKKKMWQTAKPITGVKVYEVEIELGRHDVGCFSRMNHVCKSKTFKGIKKNYFTSYKREIYNHCIITIKVHLKVYTLIKKRQCALWSRAFLWELILVVFTSVEVILRGLSKWLVGCFGNTPTRLTFSS